MQQLPFNAIPIGDNRAVVCNYKEKCLDVFQKDDLPEGFHANWSKVASLMQEADEADWFTWQDLEDDAYAVALAYFWQDLREEAQGSRK